MKPKNIKVIKSQLEALDNASIVHIQDPSTK